MTQALRSLLKSPGYTVLAVLALALGIGANTVLFSAINAVFLRPLPFPEAHRLLRIHTVFADRGMAEAAVSWPRFTALRDQQDRLTGVAATAFGGFTLTGRGDPEQVPGQRATHNLFSVLGVQPVLGRAFTAEEDAPGGPEVVMLSHAFWRKHFAQAPEVIGGTVILDGRPRTIVGVLPPLPFPFDQPEVWAPRVFEADGIPPELRDLGTGYLNVIARTKPGITLEQAAEQLRVIHSRYAAANPEKVDAKAGINPLSLQEDMVGEQRPMLMTLLAAVGCVLLVACANVANLLLARFAARRKEIAVRVALGATRTRLAVQFLTESVLTAAVAGAFGILLALWGIGILRQAAAPFLPRADELDLDWRVLGFAVAVTLLTGVALGLVPACQAAATSSAEALKDSARGSTGGRRAGRFRNGLVVLEVALSLVLLVGASLLTGSFLRLQHVETGFRTDGISTFFLALPPSQYADQHRQALFFQQALERIKALPGVTQAVATNGLPVVGGGARSPAAADGESLPPMAQRLLTRRNTTTPGFFATFDVPLLRGRDFTWADRAGAPNVVIINERLAKRLFPDQDPIGRRIITGIQSIPREVVGVFADMRSQNLAEPVLEEMFYPAMQVDGAFLTVAVRSERPAESLRPELVAAVRAVDPGLPVQNVQTFAEQLSGTLADRQLAMYLLGGFAALALILAGMGIYSVIAYGVTQRTNEFGIRIALGAEPATVVRMVLREGVALAALGLLVGTVLAASSARFMQGLLFDVSAGDPLVFAGVALFLVLVTVLACLFPARAATKVDPLRALRAD